MAEVLTVAESRAADAEAIAQGTSGQELMRRAGEGAADRIVERWTPRRTLVLCGPGSNGGDGYVIARSLHERGWAVSVAGGEPAADAADAWAARKALPLEVRPLLEARIEEAELVVDALFGAGLSRPLEGAPRQALENAEGLGRPILAVDLPSGLPGDAARPIGYAPRASATITFHRKKPAHLLQPGRSFCGEVEVVDIGLAAPVAPRLFENDEALWGAKFPRPAMEGYKMSRGHLMVVSGPALRTGAARLAARGGLRIGAGLVTVLTPKSAALVAAIALEAIMVAAFADTDALKDLAQKATAAVIGPGAGIGRRTRDNVLALKDLGLPLVLDADALTSFKDDPETLFERLGPNDVLTPHPGEFERVFPGLLAASPDRILAVRKAASRAGAVVLLKGPDTVVAAPDGRASINAHASPHLATAGSGDVLAGLIGGLRAQGLDSFLAASAGVFLHGDAGLRVGPGLIAEDLPEAAAQSLRRLYLRRNWRLAEPL